MKKFFASLFCAGLSALSFAEDAVTVDLSAAGDAADAMKTSFTGLVTSKLVGASLAVVGALVVLWAIPRIPGWISIGKKR